MICSESDLDIQAQVYFQNEANILKLSAIKFSPREFKCEKEVASGRQLELFFPLKNLVDAP